MRKYRIYGVKPDGEKVALEEIVETDDDDELDLVEWKVLRALSYWERSRSDLKLIVEEVNGP